MIKKCPVCDKKDLKWNYWLRRWECPKVLVNRREKPGCGYINEQPTLAEAINRV